MMDAAHGVRSGPQRAGSRRDCHGFAEGGPDEVDPLVEQAFLAIEESIDIVRGEFKGVTVGDGVCRACFDAIAAKNTARVIDVIHAREALAGRDTLRVAILSCLDVDAIRRAGRSTQKTAHTLLEPVFVAVENMDATVTRLEVNRLMRIIFSNWLPPEVAKRDAEPLEQGGGCFSGLSKHCRHANSV